jgi:CMP/dCMP kinase
MYRGLTWLALQRDVDPSDGPALAALARDVPMTIEPTDDGDRVRVDGQDVTEAIRLPEVSGRVSEVSAHPGVRDEMVAAQRALLSRGGWVSDGRDVGTVVCPGADLKVFLTANLEERAHRRRVELARRGVEADEATVIEDVRRRDHLDTTRDTSPLRVAPGAVVIDSSEMQADEVVEQVVRLVEALRAASA